MSKVRGQSGFTLTELLISVVVIAIGVVGFASAVGLASTELWVGKRDTEVSMALVEQAEILKATPYDSLQSGSSTIDEYDLTWTVVGVDPKRVVLEATFHERDGAQLADTIVIVSSK